MNTEQIHAVSIIVNSCFGAIEQEYGFIGAVEGPTGMLITYLSFSTHMLCGEKVPFADQPKLMSFLMTITNRWIQFYGFGSEWVRCRCRCRFHTISRCFSNRLIQMWSWLCQQLILACICRRTVLTARTTQTSYTMHKCGLTEVYEVFCVHSSQGSVYNHIFSFEKKKKTVLPLLQTHLLLMMNNISISVNNRKMSKYFPSAKRTGQLNCPCKHFTIWIWFVIRALFIFYSAWCKLSLFTYKFCDCSQFSWKSTKRWNLFCGNYRKY